MLDQIPQVFRGHLDDCWQEFCRQFYQKVPRNSKGLSNARNPMVTFCRVQNQSIHRWMLDEPTLPLGGTRIRLMCYLILHGYKIIEFERLPMSLRAMTELIGFSVVSSDDVCQHLGYSENATLYDVLRENQNASEAVLEKMRSLYKEKKAELEEKKEDSYRTLRLKFMVDENPPKETLRQQVPLFAPTEDSPSAVFSAIHGLLDVFNQGTFNALSDEDIRVLNLDPLMILELSTYLSQLSARVIKLKNE